MIFYPKKEHLYIVIHVMYFNARKIKSVLNQVIVIIAIDNKVSLIHHGVSVTNLTYTIIEKKYRILADLNIYEYLCMWTFKLAEFILAIVFDPRKKKRKFTPHEYNSLYDIYERDNIKKVL